MSIHVLKPPEDRLKIAGAAVWIACALSVLSAGSVQGQKREATTTEIDITLNGACDGIRKVSVVVDGQDAPETWLKANPVSGDQCHWRLTAPDRVSTRYGRISLRINDGVRTECHKGDAEFPNGEPVAMFNFDCCNPEKARSVSIEPSPSMPVSYVREISADVPSMRRHPQRRPCVEYGTIEKKRSNEKPSRISPIHFGAETLFLQIGWNPARRKLAGLNVNELPEVRKGGSISLTAAEIVHRLSVQRVRGNKSAPSLPPAAMDIDSDYLKEIKLKTVGVTVQ